MADLPPLSFPVAGEQAFHRELKRRAHAYLSARDDHRFADAARWAKAMILLLLCVGFYLLSLVQHQALAF
ncbi:MAG: acyl-CoA desaturase, partial [Serratia liquefaciens]|nr:acyl-CoA desaturase [Serratia liquefaciens]